MKQVRLFRGRRSRRGSALILTLFFMILLYGLAASYCALVPMEVRNALRLQDDSEAFYVADSGISDAIARMENEVATNHQQFEILTGGTFWTTTSGIDPQTTVSPTLGTAFNSSPNARQCIAFKSYVSPLGENLSYRVRLERWAFKLNGERVPDSYRITSEAVKDHGTAAPKVRRSVVSWVNQKNFSEYLYCVNKLPSAIWLNLNTFKMDGPYHTNDRVLINPPDNWNDRRGPSFLAQLSWPLKDSSRPSYKTNNPDTPDGIFYNTTDKDRLPWNSNKTSTSVDRYQRIIDGGANRFHRTENAIKLPDDSSKIGIAAFGRTQPDTLTSTLPSSVHGTDSAVNLHMPKEQISGAYPDLTAGIVVEGDVDSITLAAPQAGGDGNGKSDDNTNSVMTIKQTVTRDEAIVPRPRRGPRTRTVTEQFTSTVTTVYETMTVPGGALINGSTTPTAGPTILTYANNQRGYTVVRDGTSNRYNVYQGVGNGAVYVDGDIKALKGVNRGRKTIATSMDTGSNTAKDHKIWINGALTRADSPVGTKISDGKGWQLASDGVTWIDPRDGSKPTGTKPTGVRDQLGVVSYAVRLKKDRGVSDPMWPVRALTNEDNPLLLYAAIFAGRKDDPRSTDNTNGGGMGTDGWDLLALGSGRFKLFGSLTEGTRQVKGTFGGSSTGYDYEYVFDTNFNHTNPPFYPGTSGFRMMSWTEAPYRQQ